MVALQPIPIKNRNIPQKQRDSQRQTDREVLIKVLPRVIPPLTFKQHPSTESVYFNVLWADGNFRRFKLVLAALLADCQDYSSYLNNLDWHVSFWCECPTNKFGDDVHPDKQYPQQDYNLYRMHSDASTKAPNAELLLCHVHQGFNIFDTFPVW